MKDFSRPRGRLRALPLPARVVYSVFLGFTLAALGLTAWLGSDMLGGDLDGVREYYAGVATDAAGTPPPAPSVGPVLDLPEEATAPSAPEPVPLRKLLEVTHFHLFSMPVYLLILSHLFMLSRARDLTKLTWISLGTVGTVTHCVAPWIARADHRIATPFYATSGSMLAVSMLVMALWPLWEMWAAE